MPITSYAQNFEDVMLARAFPGAAGFYVDVGANDPDIDNVSRNVSQRERAESLGNIKHVKRLRPTGSPQILQ